MPVPERVRGGGDGVCAEAGGGVEGPEPGYLASGAACPCARPPRRQGSSSQPGPTPGALAVWHSILTAWCSSPLLPASPTPLPAAGFGGWRRREAAAVESARNPGALPPTF